MQNTKREKIKLLILFLTGGCCVLLSGLVLLNSHILEASESNITSASTIYTSSYQDEVEEELENKKNKGNYTEDNMLIIENPYGTNTLSLYVYFTSKEAVSVSYEISVQDTSIPNFEGKPASESDYSTKHEFQVIGLLPEQKNTITFTLEKENGTKKTYSYTHKMGSLLGKEEVQLENTKASQTKDYVTDGLYVILGNDSEEKDFMYYYDNAGVIRGEVPLIGYRSHRLLFQDGLMYYSISTNKMAAVNTLGKVEKVYDTGQYNLHHDYVFDDDGNLLVLATDTEKNTVEDQIIKIDTKTGEVSHVLDLEDCFKSYKEQCVSEDDEEMDWMHINTIQWLGNGQVLLSSRETSTIIFIDDLYENPQVKYMIGEESFWENTEYKDLLLEKDESSQSFSNTGGQHSITYVKDDTLDAGEYYLYMFNNNFGKSSTNPSYDWNHIDGIETSETVDDDSKASYFYKYKVDENNNTYTLVQSFEVPFSPYVSSVQEYDGNLIIDSGMKGVFGEYDADGNLIQQFKMKLSDQYIYRVYKYTFTDFYFSE